MEEETLYHYVFCMDVGYKSGKSGSSHRSYSLGYKIITPKQLDDMINIIMKDNPKWEQMALTNVIFLGEYTEGGENNEESN